MAAIHNITELNKYKDVLKADVFAKLEFFMNTPAETEVYSTKSTSWQKVSIAPANVTGSYNMYFSSDEMPYYARTSQRCYQSMGVYKPGTTNLYVWVLPYNSGNKMLNLWNPSDAFYTFAREVRQHMFKPGTPEAVEQTFISTFGWVFTPSIVDKYPSPVIVGLLVTQRPGLKSSGVDLLIEKIGGPESFNNSTAGSMGGCYWFNNWTMVDNILNQRFNESFKKLEPYSKCPDYSCWNNPIYNLFSDNDVTDGGKLFPSRATDIHWDKWVEKGSHGWYGRGHTGFKKDGEVVADLKALTVGLSIEDGKAQIRKMLESRVKTSKQLEVA